MGGLTPMRMLGNESYSSMNPLVPGSSPGGTAKTKRYAGSPVVVEPPKKLAGCSSVWLEHLLWEQRVVGSNPVTPIN